MIKTKLTKITLSLIKGTTSMTTMSMKTNSMKICKMNSEMKLNLFRMIKKELKMTRSLNCLGKK